MKSIVYILITGAFILSPLLNMKLKPDHYEGGRSRNLQARQARNESAIAQMLGGMRTSMSDILFLKTERYLHFGVAYKAHLENDLQHIAENENDGEQHEAHEDHDEHETHEQESEHGHDHGHGEGAGTPTLIKSKQEDFRGFIGDLERKIKPYQEAEKDHTLAGGNELLPWYRVMTLVDPQNERAYITASFWLKRENLDAGLQFLEEGMRVNPNSFQLRFSYGNMLLHKGREMLEVKINYAEKPPAGSETEKYYLKAADVFEEGARFAIRQRPQNWSEDSKDPSWDIYMEEDALGAMRMAVLCEGAFRDRNKALDLAKQYSQIITDPILLNIIQRFEARK